MPAGSCGLPFRHVNSSFPHRPCRPRARRQSLFRAAMALCFLPVAVFWQCGTARAVAPSAALAPAAAATCKRRQPPPSAPCSACSKHASAGTKFTWALTAATGSQPLCLGQLQNACWHAASPNARQAAWRRWVAAAMQTSQWQLLCRRRLGAALSAAIADLHAGPEGCGTAVALQGDAPNRAALLGHRPPLFQPRPSSPCHAPLPADLPSPSEYLPAAVQLQQHLHHKPAAQLMRPVQRQRL